MNYRNCGSRVIAGILCAMMAVFVLASCEQTVTPTPAPVITISTQPAAATNVTQGGITGALNVGASVTEGAALAYQWYSNTSASVTGGTKIDKAVNASYTIPTGLTAGTYYYYCEVSAQGAAPVTSNVATVKVNPAGTPAVPVITISTQPAAATTVTQGSITGSLGVAASVTQGTLAYQWYSNTSASVTGGTKITNATGAAYTIPAGLTAGTYYYYCELSAQGAETKYTTVATVKVNSSDDTSTVLEPDTWTSGSLGLHGTKWYSFKATDDIQFIHLEGITVITLDAQLYDSNRNPVGEKFYFSYGGRESGINYQSMKTGDTYYIKVTTTHGGEYRIGFKSTPEPIGVSATELTIDTWSDEMTSEMTSDYCWFRFTAASDIQYLHGYYQYFELYDSNINRVEYTYTLLTTGRYINRAAVTKGDVYYIKARYFSSKVAYTNSMAPPASIIELTLDTWADGDLRTKDDEQWFRFTAKSNTQFIHVIGSLGGSWGINLAMYDSNGIAVEDMDMVTTLFGLHGNSSHISPSVTSGDVYYIRTWWTGVNTYKIGFTNSIMPPEPTKLTFDTWADGNIPTVDGEQWYSFTATIDRQLIHVNFGTLTKMNVYLYDSNGNEVEDMALDGSTGTSQYIALPVINGDIYYIRVKPYSSSYAGTYKIGFKSSPAPIGVSPTVLTLDTWADGEFTTSNKEQWFSFTSTADTQYIRASSDTMTRMWVHMYASSGEEVETTDSLLYSDTSFIAGTVTNGQVYYIKVTPYSNAYSGTYKIGFRSSPAPFGVSPTELTLDTWADGDIPTVDGEQWYSFTATIDRQLIHVNFGTLTNMYVQLYDSSGNTVETNARLYDNTTSIARPVTSGQVYYIKVTPYSSSYSGTYKIGFTSSLVPPEPTKLTLDTWADGEFTTSNKEQWFSFTATATTQFIHASLGTLIYIYTDVQLYDSNGNTVGERTTLYNNSTQYTSRPVTNGQVYYIKVTPHSNVYSGTYKIAFSNTPVSFGFSPPKLTADTWADGDIPTSNGEEWFRFTATADTQYIHASFGTLTNMHVQLYDNNWNEVGSIAELGYYTYITTSVTNGAVYYIKVKPYYNSYSGTYKIGFTSTPAPLGVSPTELTLDTWADGEFTTSDREQWFSFTATAATQFIHASFGTTLYSMYVRLYDSSGNTVGYRTNLPDSGNNYMSQSVTNGAVYFIKVTPSNSSSSGTYKIGFTGSLVPPN